MSIPFEYVNTTYGTNACIGRVVIVNGKPGVIAADRGHYIGVNFDDDKPGVISNCHPTWRIEYLGITNLRKLTQSQLRGLRWREYGDWFESFMDFVYWDMEQQKEGRNL